MTDKQKAKAYDEALERAKKILCNINEYSDSCKDIETIFPELAESEDEIHRKWILEYLYEGLQKSDEQFKEQFKSAIAYLEKQKEQKPKVECDRAQPVEQAGTAEPDYGICGDFVPGKLAAALRRHGWYLGHVGENQQMVEARKEEVMRNWPADRYSLTQEQKPAEWSEDIIRKAVKEVGLTQHQIDWFKTNVFPPRQEWDEEDNFNLNWVIAILNGEPCDLDIQVESLISWLKSLPARFVLEVKREWSEEDEKKRSNLMSLLANMRGDRITEETYQKYYPWLKSLRPQPNTVSIKDATKFGNLEYERGVKDGIQHVKNHHWKPSEEQIEAFKKYIEEFQARAEAAVGGWNNFDVMVRLYEQLKNLV